MAEPISLKHLLYTLQFLPGTNGKQSTLAQLVECQTTGDPHPLMSMNF